MENIGNELQKWLAVSNYTWEDVLAMNLYFKEDGQEHNVKLKVNYTRKELDNVLNTLGTYEYDPCDELYQFDLILDGTVWFKNGSWLEREIFDGCEWWELRSRPEIPDELQHNV